MSTRLAAPAATPPSPPIFTVTIPGQAAYLICHSPLRYVGARYMGRGQQVTFAFEDPLGLGEQLIAEYKRSAFREYTEAHKFLRDEIHRVVRTAEMADVKPIPVR